MTTPDTVYTLVSARSPCAQPHPVCSFWMFDTSNSVHYSRTVCIVVPFHPYVSLSGSIVAIQLITVAVNDRLLNTL